MTRRCSVASVVSVGGLLNALSTRVRRLASERTGRPPGPFTAWFETGASIATSLIRTARRGTHDVQD